MKRALNVIFSFLGFNSFKRLAIGDSYQGGKIAYIDSTGLHGLVAAPNDQNASIQWHDGINKLTNATGVAIGLGNTNTQKIVASQGIGRYAAKLCYDLELDGYSDWYLPSKDELNKLCFNREAIGGFARDNYWSSTGDDNSSAWDQDFLTGYQSSNDKSITSYVRAVRTF